ncbi:MucBP domain-containing protein [Lactiplantibacillus xiangfangensis]|uniref:MucBP domain-containing protein n=1 Tax=Lactiplantibacillus xiangfangensis TaxID=942150 RepID=A0A0R2MHP9_9LACO|nr:MucBP domain-containing protein [Lactiplantibacillus xiangfangensis]KRO11011.1 hypothetical protein IV64_GL002707 [Lactiplantibacillus xiangfangensis]
MIKGEDKNEKINGIGAYSLELDYRRICEVEYMNGEPKVRVDTKSYLKLNIKSHIWLFAGVTLTSISLGNAKLSTLNADAAVLNSQNSGITEMVSKKSGDNNTSAVNIKAGGASVNDGNSKSDTGIVDSGNEKSTDEKENTETVVSSNEETNSVKNTDTASTKSNVERMNIKTATQENSKVDSNSSNDSILRVNNTKVISPKTVVRRTAMVRSANTSSTTTVTDYNSATPIASNEKAIIPKKNDRLNSKYSFIPKANASGKTKVTAIGDAITSTGTNRVAVNMRTSAKGQTGFKYTNVGYDAVGRSVDMELIYTNWGRMDTNDTPYIEAYTNKIKTDLAGVGWADVEYRFLSSDTETPVAVSGLLTLTDIDGSQSVSLNNKQWSQIDNVYIPESDDPTTGKVDNWLRYVANDDYLTIVSPSDNSGNTDEYAMLTFTYTNLSVINFRISNGRTGKNKVENVWGVNYIAQKPLATAVIAPSITVSDDDQINVSSNTLRDGEANYNYTFTQQIPDEWAAFYYHDILFSGKLPSDTRLTNYRVTDESGNDITPEFIDQSDGQNFKLGVATDYVGSKNFYGHRYTVNISVIASQADVIQNFQMKVKTNIDGDVQSSNQVITVIPKKKYVITHYYLAGTTTKMAEDQTDRVIKNDSYTTNSVDIAGYQQLVPKNVTGVMGDNNIVVIYQYSPVSISIPIEYVDQNKTHILSDTVIKGNYDKAYDASSLVKRIKGYSLVKVDNQSGQFKLDNSPVIVHYQAQKVTIPVIYVDQNGKSILPATSITGYYNDPYEANRLLKDVHGYSFKNAINSQGQYQLVNPTIIFHYQALPGSVDVKYLDLHTNNNLSSSKIYNGFYGDNYDLTMTNKSFTGYHLIKTLGGLTDSFGIGNKSVVYQFMPDKVTIHVKNVTDLNETLGEYDVSGYYNDTYEIQTLKDLPTELAYSATIGSLRGKFGYTGESVVNEYRYSYGNTTKNGNGALTTIYRNGDDDIVGLEQMHVDGNETYAFFNADGKLQAGEYSIDNNSFVNLSNPMSKGDYVILTSIDGSFTRVDYLQDGSISISKQLSSLDTKGDSVTMAADGNLSFSTLHYKTISEDLSKNRQSELLQQVWPTGETVTVNISSTPTFAFADVLHQLRFIADIKCFDTAQSINVDGSKYQFSKTKAGLLVIQQINAKGKPTYSSYYTNQGQLVKSDYQIENKVVGGNKSYVLTKYTKYDQTESLLEIQVGGQKITITSSFGLATLRVVRSNGTATLKRRFNKKAAFELTNGVKAVLVLNDNSKYVLTLTKMSNDQVIGQTIVIDKTDGRIVRADTFIERTKVLKNANYQKTNGENMTNSKNEHSERRSIVFSKDSPSKMNSQSHINKPRSTAEFRRHHGRLTLPKTNERSGLTLISLGLLSLIVLLTTVLKRRQ